MSFSLIDKGELTQPVLVFGGPYGNLQATQAIKSLCDEKGIAPSHVICTGDAVAYCAQPQETSTLLKDWGITLVKGNCEEAMAKQSPDCGCGFAENTACSLLSVQWYQYCQKQVSPDICQWMDKLPESVSFTLGGKRFLVVHASTTQMNEFVFASDVVEGQSTIVEQMGHDVIIGGHCGIPFGQTLSQNKAWLNAGVIGMPANDGQQKTWYMVLTPVNSADALSAQGGINVSWHRLEYDVESAVVAMQDAGLNNGYAQCLTSGLWPSMDVLPKKEASKVGQAIVLAPLIL